MLRVASYRFGEPGMVSQHLYQAFLYVLWVEHSAFAVLLLSGAAMAWLLDLYYGRLTRIALWVMPLAVTLIIWLAVGKATTLETYTVCTYTQTMDSAWDPWKADRKGVRQHYKGLSL